MTDPAPTGHPDLTAIIALAVVMLCWFLFFLIFVLQKRPKATAAAKRDWFSLTGILLQTIGFGLVWFLRRDPATAILQMPPTFEIVLAALAAGLAMLSVWGTLSAVRTLGQQWSLSARLTQDHRLITSGPYRLVRHPIYACMFGLMLATGLVVSRPWAFGPAIVLFAVGTAIRIQSEEKLLRARFGEEYDQYAHRVPAVIPWSRRT